MKKVYIFAAVAVSLIIMVSASVWEGAAAIGENFSDNGPYLATNSFPVNTLVEVVNLENRKTAILIVSAALENSKLLALLSKDAAAAIGLSNIGRIRMNEKDDQVLFSSGYNSNLAFDTADLRPPKDENSWEPDPGSIIPPISIVTEPPVVTVITVIPSIPEQLPPPPAVTSATTPHFSARLIQSFEKGSYYVQIGAYEKTQTVESEILKIDKNLPVAVMETVMKIGNAEKLVYRVLIGPLNLAESGAVFQKYKTIYKDAFLWIGS